MEVTYCFFDVGQLVDIIDCLGGVWAKWIGGEQFNVVYHSRIRGGSVKRVERLVTSGHIEEECVHVQVGDVCLERLTP